MKAPDPLLPSHGANLVTREGERAGTIEDIYLDRETERPAWVLVHTGLFGELGTFVPLVGATAHGSDVVVPYGKDQIKGAPSMERGAELSPRGEADLYAYYGLSYGRVLPDAGRERSSDRRRRAGGDERGSSRDDSMTAAEERRSRGRSSTRGQPLRLKRVTAGDRLAGGPQRTSAEPPDDEAQTGQERAGRGSEGRS